MCDVIGITNPLQGNVDGGGTSTRYRVKFHYLSKQNTLDGSVVVSGDKRGMFSHDTDGSVTFEEFGETIKGTFEFITFKGSSEEGSEKVAVKGSFELPRGDAFKKKG